MFTLQDVKEIELERIINYIHQKNKKIKFFEQEQQIDKSQTKKKQPINMKSLVLTLKNNTIDYLKNQFILNDNKITVEKFLYLMKECITYQSSNQYEIFYQLIKLFEEIDIDSSKQMEWSQFLQYLAGYGWLGDNKERKDKNQKDKYLNWVYKQQNKYRKHNILKIVQVQKLNMICLLQAASFSLTFINLDGTQFTHVPKNQQNNQSKQQKQKPQLFTLSSVNLKKVLSIDYCDQQRLFGILMTDKSLIFIQDGDIQKVVINILGNGQQSQILYLSIHKVWLIRSINGLIQIIQSPKQAKLKQRISFTPHEEPLTSIKQLKNPLCLCTSSLDGTIKLWSINYKQLLISLNPIINQQQTIERMKGIKGIDTLNLHSNSYIASWTFTTQIGLWLPSSSVSKPYVGKLKGHIGIIQNCQFSKHKQYLISIDHKKSIRVWNVQKMICLQMLASEGDTTLIKCLKSQSLALIYSKIIDFYRIKTNTKIDNTHLARVDFTQQKKKIVTVSFCPYYIYLLLLFNTQLRVFDVNSGKLITVIYPEKRQEEEFVCVGLKINRRIFIGSTHGNIYYHNLDTGNLIKKFKVENFQGSQKYVGIQIKFIFYHGQSKVLLVIAQQNNVSIILTYRQQISFQFQLTKVLEFQQINLKKYGFNKKYQTLAIANQKVLTLWDFQKMNIINSISPDGEQINDFNLIQKFNLLIILTKTKMIIYQLEKQGFIKKIQIINLTVKLMNTITKFNVQISNNQGLEINSKQKKMKKTVNKEKSVKFIIEQNIQNNSQLNQHKKTTKLKSSQHILVNKNSKIKQLCILYLTSLQGVVYAFQATDILIRKQTKQTFDVKPSIYAGHSIRQFRKCTIKMLKNYRQSKQITDFEENLLFFKQIFSQKITEIGSIYSEVFYILNLKGDISILKTSGQILATLSFGQSQFSYWNLNYNMLSKILERLNKLQWILNMNKKKNNIEGGQNYKVKFIANLYLNQIDLIQMKEYSKMSTVKSFNASKQNMFIKKYTNGSSIDIKSFNKIKLQQNQDFPKQTQWNLIKKKSKVMSQKMKINQSKKSTQIKKQNFFNEKYENKKLQDQKAKIHRKYIQKRIQRTLSYAKNIQALNKQKPQNDPFSNKKQIQKGVNFIQKLEKALNQIPKNADFANKCSLYDLDLCNKIDLKILQKQKQSSIHRFTDNFTQKKYQSKNIEKQFFKNTQIKRAQSSHNVNRYNQKQQNVKSLKSLYKIQGIGIKSFIKKQFLPIGNKEKTSTVIFFQKGKNKLQL